MIDSVSTERKRENRLGSVRFSFRAALDGIGYAMRTQRNMKFHVLASTFVFLFATFFSVDFASRVALALCVGLVVFAELVNTALESLVDLASPRFHPLAKAAKDTAAGAVLVLAGVSTLILVMVVHHHWQDIQSRLGSWGH